MAYKTELAKTTVKSLIDKVRKKLPRLGTRKLYHLIGPDLKRYALKVGRDRLFAWMKDYGLLIQPRRRYVQTTNSKHWFRKYPNLVKGIEIARAEQVWVSDITYIKTGEGNLYLSLVTDAYSRKIMGYSIADNMEATTVSKALTMAISARSCDTELIHHSDRGMQYCSKEYVQIAKSHNIIMSMTENGDPYENALAERMNKTIKEEFFPHKEFKSKQLAIDMTKEAIELYNQYRPHLSLQMSTPEQVHKTKIPAVK